MLKFHYIMWKSEYLVCIHDYIYVNTDIFNQLPTNITYRYIIILSHCSWRLNKWWKRTHYWARVCFCISVSLRLYAENIDTCQQKFSSTFHDFIPVTVCFTKRNQRNPEFPGEAFFHQFVILPPFSYRATRSGKKLTPSVFFVTLANIRF